MYTSFRATSSGNNTLIAGVSGQLITIRAMYLQCAVATNITFKSGTTSLSGPMCYLIGGGLVVPYDPNGFSPFELQYDDSFVINLSGLTPDVSGFIYYTQT